MPFLLHEGSETYLLRFRLRLQGPHVLCMEERQASALCSALICTDALACQLEWMIPSWDSTFVEDSHPEMSIVWRIDTSGSST